MNEKSKPISETAIGLSTECSGESHDCTSKGRPEATWNVDLVTILPVTTKLDKVKNFHTKVSVPI